MENFKKLNSAEKKHLMEEIFKKTHTLHFKFESSQVYKAKIVHGKKTDLLTVRRPANFSLSLHRKMATVIIAIEQERYFLVCPALVDAQTVQFTSDGAIYHLHRRKLRRTIVPGVYPASLMIKKVHDSLSFLKAVIFDISDQGLRVGLHSDVPAVKVGWEIVGTLRLGTRRGIEVKCRVRHQSLHPKSTFKQIFGLEIVDMSEYSKSLYKNQLLDLQRDIFVIFMGG